MSQDTHVNNLIINKLTKQQFESIATPDPTQLYLITDDSGITSTDITTALGYTPENVTNKVVSLSSSSTDTQYPSAKLVYDQLALKQPLISSTAMLSSDLVDDTNKTHKFATSAQLTQISTNTGDISTINGKIPSAATTTNQLADKSFVNSSISTNTANFIGTFNSVSSLEAYSGTITNNDYAFVVNSVVTDNGNDWANTTALNTYDKTLLTNFDYAWVINGTKFDLYRFDIVNQIWGSRATSIAKTDVTLNTAYNRYKATVVSNTVTWDYEYTLNNSSFTAVQWAAINSGITSGDVTLIGTALQPSDIDQTYNGASTNAQSGVAIANELTTNYQSKLISGTNIKTINNTSLLGSGNINISAGNITYNSTNERITWA